ncbi:MAG: PotD/PotF family extracellular solute-binding protein, partial [Actinomycetota bacterium]
ANLEDQFVKPSLDPTGEYSLPWQSGSAGIAYNISVTGRELKSVKDLLDPEFNGRIAMLTEMRDTVGLLLLSEGIDPSSVTSFDDAAVAFELLEKAKADGQIRAFTGNDYTDDLSNGNFAACVAWSGDVLQLSADNPDVRFVIPEEGGMLWWDAMVIPKGAKNRDAIAKWMNFVYDPVEAAKITAWVQYSSPVKGVREEVAKIDPALAENPLVFPDAETVSRLNLFAPLDSDVEAEFEEAFSKITGA